ncbi:MAG: type II secretion system F family protein [Pseudomonadota bacterium]|nr:type II secretion system F family protein [Pseudomonadota bacterium]
MEWAFYYSAIGQGHQRVTGIVFADHSDKAFSKLKRIGYQPLEVRLHVTLSMKNLFKAGFCSRDLSRLYKTLGRRLMNGRSLEAGLEAGAGFVQDEKLRQAAKLMRQSLLEGQREYDAMRLAGFSQRDAMVVRAAHQSGKTGEAFRALGADIERQASLKGRIGRIFRMPVFMMLMMYGFFYGALRYLTPRTLIFMQNINASVPSYDEKLFALSTWVNQHPFFFTFIYLMIPVGIFLMVRSKAFKAVLDQVDLIREISIKADQSTLWTGYSLLHEAAIAPAEIAITVSDAAAREDSRKAFLKLSRILQTGIHLDAATQAAGFPSFITDGVKAAQHSGSLLESLKDMTRDLEEDVLLRTEQLTENVRILSTLITGIMVMVFFFVTYYPVVSLSLNNV